MKIVPKSFLMPSIKYRWPISEVLWPVRRQTISTTCLKSFEQVIVKRSVFFPARLGGEKFNESWLMMICPLQKKVEKKYSYEKMAAGITVLGKAYVTPAAFWGRSPVFVLPGIFPGRTVKMFLYFIKDFYISWPFPVSGKSHNKRAVRNPNFF